MAARYWVGGTGTWDNTAGSKWALTSGGAGGEAVPTAADDVFFDSASGANTITIGITAQALTLTMTGFSSLGILAFGTNKIQIAGNDATVCNLSGNPYTVTGTPIIELTYAGSTGTRTILFNASTVIADININIISGSDQISIGTGVTSSINFTGFTGTWSPGSSSYTIYRSFILSTGMTVSASTGGLTLRPLAGNTSIINLQNKSLNAIQTATSSAGGTIQLEGNITCVNFTINDMSLNLNNFTINVTSQLSTGSLTSATRVIAFGSSGSFRVTGTSSNPISLTGSVLRSITGTPNVYLNATGAGTRTCSFQASTEALSVNLFVESGSHIFALANNSGLKSLDFTGFTGSWSPSTASATFYRNLTIPLGMTFTNGSGTWTFAATSGTQVITSNGKLLNSITQNSPGATLQLNGTTSLGTNGTFTHTAGTLDLQSTTFTIARFTNSSSTSTRSIAFGTGNITCIGSSINPSVFTQSDHTGFSYTGTPTINISVPGSTARSVAWGSVGGSASTVLDFNFTTGSYVLSFGGNPNYARIVNFTGFTGTWEMVGTSSIYRFYGNLTLSSGMTVTSNSASNIQLQGTGTQVITSAGKSLPNVLQNEASGTVLLADDLTLNNDAEYRLQGGAFSTGIYNFSTGSFVTDSGSLIKNINMGSGTWTISSLNTTSAALSVWTLQGTNLTFNAGTANINIIGAGNSRINFVGGSRTYNNLNITSTTGSPVVSIFGNNTFNTISSSKTDKWMLQFASGSTNNITTFSVNGSSSSNLVTIRTDTLTAATSTLNVTNSFTTDYALVNDVTLSSSNGTINNGYISPTATNWTRGSGTNYIQIISSGTSWQVPTTWNSSDNAIHIVGAGGGGSGTTIATTTANRIGGAGGGGGGYSKLVNQTYTPNTYVFCAVGAVGAGAAGATGGGTSTGGTGGTTRFGLAQNEISLISSALSVQNTASTTITVNVPSVSNGQLMLMYVNSANVSQSWTTPSGWTLPSSGSSSGRAIFYRTASSEPASYTVTQTGSTTSSAYILVYSNATFDVARITAQTPAATQSPSAITPGTAGTTMVYFASSASASATFTTPTGYTPIASDSDATAPSNAVFDISLRPSGSYVAPSTTVSTGTCYAGIVSIAPTTTGSYTTATGGTGGVSSGGTTNTAGVGGTGTGGTLNYTGGTGGVSTASTTTGVCSGGGGGGSSGPLGNGGNGGNGATGANSSVVGGGGGGGNGGGTSAGNGGAGLGGAGGNNADGVGGGASSANAQPGVLGGGASGAGGGIASGSINGLGYDIIGYYGASGGGSGPAISTNGNSNGSYGGGASGGAQGTSTTTVQSGGSGGLGLIIVLWNGGGTSYTDSITENSSLIDITSLLGQFAVARTEDFTALDSYVTTTAFAVSQTENSILDDVKTGTVIFQRSITEVTQLTDLYSYNGWFKIDTNQLSSWDSINDTQSAGWNTINSSQIGSWNNVDNTSETSAWNNINDTQSAGWNIINSSQAVSWNNLDNTSGTAWTSINDTQSAAWNTVNSSQAGSWNNVDNTSGTAWDPINNNNSAPWDPINNSQ